MDDEFRIRRRRVDIQAVHWNGSNHDEVRRFFAACGMDPVDGPYFDTWEDIQFDGYNMVRAQGCGGIEAGQDTWITFDGDDYETWSPSHFESVFDCS